MKAKKREAQGTRACRRLREQGEVPAIVYGHEQDVLPVQVNRDDLDAALRHHSRMFDLKIGRKKETVLLRDIQYDAFGDEVVHADFLRVAMDEAINLEVPIELKGQVKHEHAVLQQALDTVEVECLPSNIPDALLGHIGGLEVGDSLRVGDLVVPEGVKVLSDPETAVATLTHAAAEAAEGAEEELGAAVAGTAEPEVIGREEKAEEGEEEEAGD